MQQVDDPPSLPVGTEVSAKYKGAFCEAKVSKVVRNIKVKVAFKHGLGSGIVSDDAIKSGLLRVGGVVEVKHPDRKDTVEATVTKVQDCSQYTVVFDDGDITTLRRTALCLKSGRHFNESETLDQLPLTHPEHFGNPVVGGRRGRRRHMNDDSSDDEEESDTKEVVNEKEEHIGKVVCVDTESKKKDKEKWFPGLVVSPNAQATVRIRVKDEYLVRSFKDGRYYTVPKKEASEFTREAAAKQDGPAVQAALEYLDSDVLPAHWDRDALFDLSNSSSEEGAEMDSDSSDDEPREEKDRFVAQLYKYMDDRGTPLNKVPSIQSRDVDLYRLFRAVQKRGGYNRATTQNQWKSIAIRLGFTPVTVSVANLVKQAYKKFLQPYGEFHRKLGCSMLMTPRNSNRSKGRSLVRANSVASPKPVETSNKDSSATSISVLTKLASVSTQHPSTSGASTTVSAANVPLAVAASTVASVPSSASALQSATEESENTSESSIETSKTKRKSSTSNSKVKSLIEKYEEKVSSLIKDDGDVPLAKMKAAAAASSRAEEKDLTTPSTVIIVKDISAVQIASTVRETSPTGISPGPVKKEKYQKKQTPQSDEKRGKRKKDEVSVEKVDAGDFIVEIGDKLKVYYHEKKVTYEAKVIDITLQRGIPMYLVHYTGWNNRYDEWVPRERIAENLTKGSKQKGGRPTISGNLQHEKPKENPPKPPTVAQLQAATTSINPLAATSIIISSTSTTAKTPTSTSSRRGRGRSDSLPPRSTTPSSVASNSSRTKSPAASSASLKRRPTRTSHPSSIHRRTSANVSDVSMPTETDTDSDDEPVRRPTRAAKDSTYKASGSSVAKIPVNHKTSASATNSHTDDDTDEDEDDVANTSSCRAMTAIGISTKGRDYDLNQIRSELKGFQKIKSPSPTGDDPTPSAKGSLKVKDKPTKTEPKEEPLKATTKEEVIKSSTTDMSSETDSFADDDSQSSDKTTTLENMTKKFQQKINADKQRALVKAPASGKIITEKLTTLSTKTHIVEKIIKDSLAEKRQESLKAKPPTLLKEESKFIKIEMDLPSCSPAKSALQTEVSRPTLALSLKTEEKKPPTATVMETKSSGIIAPARFGSGSIAGSKFTSVIVEKPLNVMHKKADISSMHIKKFESPKKQQLTEKVGKKVLEQPSALHKDAVMKVEPPAVCSPTSSSSSSSSSSSTSSTSSASSRSLPDMSKLDISGSSTSSSVNNNKETTKVSTVTILKSNSPDIYEFKDPEPFEYEIRKSTLTSHSTTSSMLSALSSSAASSSLTPSHFDSKRKQVIQKHISVAPIETPSTSSVTALVTRKKRGSPLKESIVEKSKQLKLEEKPPLVLEAKLTLRSSATSSTLSTSANPLPKSSPPTQNKTVPIHTAAHTSSCSGAGVKSGVTLTTQNTASLPVTPQKHEHFDTSQKSPSFNLNINALNEELAQTVQETTRALTDALHTISTQEFTPTKAVPPASKLSVTKTNLFGSPHTVSPQLVTPPPATAPPSKPVIGSPFIETRKDLSNVFELSTTESETSGSTSGQKDNKFELENVKILLSHSVSAFDLEPAKFESKPTSIADKVLKAISQKKEVENKNKELKQVDAEKDVTCAKSVSAPTSSSGYNSNSTHDTVTPVVFSNIMKATTTSVTTASLISTPLQVLTDLPTSSSSVISTTTSSKDTVLDKTNMSCMLPGAQLAKRPLLCSPDSKLGMLESITVKNNDLSETIQKLECALQKKTPVPSNASSPAGPSPSPVSNVAAAVSAPTPTSAFSDDSMDSTDSERRLVIEDVEDAPYSGETKTNPPTTALVDSKSTSVQPPVTPIKVEAPLVSLIATPVTQQTAVIVATVPNLQSSTAIPVKMVTSGKPSTALISTSSINTIQPKFVGKLHGNTSPIILTAKPSVAQMQQSSTPVKQLQLHSPHSAAGIQTHVLSQNIQLAPTPVQSKTTEIIVSGSAAKLAEGQQIPTAGAPLKVIAAQALKRSPATVVPIVLPDIPVSVVVASSAVPSVVAAAQAAQAAQAAASQQTPPETQLGAKQSVGPIKCTSSTSSTAATTVLSSTPYVTTSSFSANSASLKTFENAAAIRNIPLKPIAVVSPSPPLPQAAVLSTSNGGLTSSKITQPTTVVTPSAFFLDARTADLRPDDGVKPILDIPTGDNGDEKSTIKTIDNNTNAAASRAATTSSSVDTHSDSINLLLCEETIPGSPAPAFGKEEPSHSIQRPSTHSSDEKLSIKVAEMLSTDAMPTSSTKAMKTITTTAGVALSANPTPNSSPNDSASQDEMSSEDLKKNIDIENEVSPRKRRRTRKQSEMTAQINDQQTKRRRPLVCGKKNTAGSDSDDNSDTISQRSTTSARPNQQQHLQQQITTGSRSCPYNFLVQLDPAMNPDQRIALLLKQIQDLRKTYHMIKGDLASIDRRRKKLRRREREKKQHMQQQQVKMST